MMTLTLSDILDDLQTAEQNLHKFERRYWLSSAHFYELYNQGLLDDGEQSEAFAEWAGHYKLWQKRQKAWQQLSADRLTQLHQAGRTFINLQPAEPYLTL